MLFYYYFLFLRLSFTLLFTHHLVNVRTVETKMSKSKIQTIHRI